MGAPLAGGFHKTVHSVEFPTPKNRTLRMLKKERVIINKMIDETVVDLSLRRQIPTEEHLRKISDRLKDYEQQLDALFVEKLLLKHGLSELSS